MKKLALFTALFTLIATLFFVACKKDDSTPTSSLELANPDNPFDYVGQKHNEGLDLLKQEKTRRGLDMAEDFQLLAKHGFGSGNHKPYVADFAVLIAADDPIKNILDKYRLQGLVSEKHYSAMMQLGEIVKTKGYSTELTVAVKTFEASIPQLNLTAKETEILYQACAIARYSNAYWMADRKNESVERRPWRILSIIAGDIAGGWIAAEAGGSVEEVIGAASAASELVDELWERGSLAAAPVYGWPWGGGILGYPCNPGYACPCTIEMDPFNIGPYYMSGIGFTLDAGVVVMAMDGSALDPQFYNMISGGNFDLTTEFTVPQNIVDHIYATGNFPVPAEATVFTLGPKEVILSDDTYTIVFPVTYPNGSNATWFVTIDQLP